MADDRDAGVEQQTGANGDADPQTGEQQQDGNGPTDENRDAGDNGRTFSQAEVERIIQGRLASERKKLGDIEALREKAEQYDKLREAQMSEAEKLQAKLEAAERERSELAERLTTTLVTQAIERAASEAGFIDTEAAVRLIDTDKLQRGDDGRPTPESLREQLDALAKRKPYLMQGGRPNGSPDAGIRDHYDRSDDMNVRLRQAAGRA